MSMPDKERMRNDVVMNDRFNRGLARKARKGDRNSQILLADIQSGAVDFTGSFGIRNANQDRDLNIGQNRVDVKNQGMWADQGAGDIPEPGQAPKAAEPQRQVNPNSKLGAGNGYAGKGQKSNGKSIQNPGPPAARAELANGTLQEQQEAIDNGGMEPSATRPAATPSARQGESGNGPPAAPADSSRKTGPNGAPETDFEMMDREARERIDAVGGWGKKGPLKEAVAMGEKVRNEFDQQVRSSAAVQEGDDNHPEKMQAREKALARADALGLDREETQNKYGWETDAQAIERKAGEKSMSEKEASNQRIAKINEGLKISADLRQGTQEENDFIARVDALKTPGQIQAEYNDKAGRNKGLVDEKELREAGASKPKVDLGIPSLEWNTADGAEMLEKQQSAMNASKPKPIISSVSSKEEAQNAIQGAGMDVLGGVASAASAVKNFFVPPALNNAQIAGNMMNQSSGFSDKANSLREKANAITGTSETAKGKKNALLNEASIFDGRAKQYEGRSKELTKKFNESGKQPAEQSKLPEETSKVVRKLSDTNQKVIADRNFFLGKEEETVPS